MIKFTTVTQEVNFPAGEKARKILIFFYNEINEAIKNRTDYNDALSYFEKHWLSVDSECASNILYKFDLKQVPKSVIKNLIQIVSSNQMESPIAKSFLDSAKQALKN